MTRCAWTPLYQKSGLSVRKVVLLSTQLIRPKNKYACATCRSPTCSHVRKQRVLQSKYFRVATYAVWSVSNRKIHEIHEDFGYSIFRRPHHSTDWKLVSKLAAAGNFFSANLLTLVGTDGWLKSPTGKRGRVMLGRRAESVPKWRTTLRKETSNYSATVTVVFLFFFTCKENARM